MTIQHIPANPNLKSLSVNEYAKIVCKIPSGYVISTKRILEFLGQRDGVRYNCIDYGFTPHYKSQLGGDFFSAFAEKPSDEDRIPYWRVVGPRGHLSDTSYMTRETQQLYLEKEGVPVKSSGRSLVVENYKDYMFDLNRLPKVTTIPLQTVIFEIESADDLQQFYFDTDTGAIADSSDGSERYLPFPSQFEIHKYNIMKTFIDSLPPCKMQHELAGAIVGKGAFNRFKALIGKYMLEEHWYGYLHEKYRMIAIDWCKKHGLEGVE